MKENTSRGIDDFFAFIPHRLQIESLPNLNVFPLNVLFAMKMTKMEWEIVCSALYEPDFDTFQVDGDAVSMGYRNTHGGDFRLELSYIKGRYLGKKVHNGKMHARSFGKLWDDFFLNLTAHGISEGEQYKIESKQRVVCG